MKHKANEKLQAVLTVIGWIVIAFALVALVMFIVRSGVFGSQK